MSAPKLKIVVGLGTDKSIKGKMSISSRQLLDIDALTEKALRLKFIQNDSTSDIDFDNNRSRHTTTLPLAGRTVLAQLGDEGRWSAKLDGRRRPTRVESSALHALTYLWAEGVYPDREVSIGETWEVDARSFKGLFGSDIQRTRGTFEFTLARIVEHEGEECARITGRGKAIGQTKSISSGATEAKPLGAEMDLSIEIFRSIRLGMDLTIKMTGTLDLNNKNDEKALTYNATGPVEFTRTFRKR